MNRSARAITMMETVLSIVLVGIVLSAAMNTLGGARVARAQTADISVAGVLCESLMSEILAQRYADAESGETSFGLPMREYGDGSRSLFDDVDDYDNWSASPPENKDGTPLAWAEGLRRTVQVECVRASDLGSTTPDGVCLKKVVVTVTRNKRILEQLEAYRSPVWPDPGEVLP